MTQTAAQISEQDGRKVITFPDDQPLVLDSGQEIAPLTLAFETYGTLNADKSNTILICHALTLDQYVASDNPLSGKPGWWTSMVGPGKTIDTDRYFVVCANVVGGCAGSTGPASINPDTQKQWGTDFPVITIHDMVRSQAMLLDHFGIDRLFAVIGGSMGGMQVLAWAVDYPERVNAAVPIATSYFHSAQNIAFHEVGRQAVMADPDWKGGDYYDAADADSGPRKGLAVARMAAHITYLSEAALTRKFGRSLQDREKVTYGFDADFQVESYLRHQGITFVDRFDANAYLYITRAMDYFDLAADHDGQLSRAFEGVNSRFCIISFTSDWLYSTAEARKIVKALNAAGGNVSFVEIDTDKGHDAFLLDEPEMVLTLTGFLDSVARDSGLPTSQDGADG